MTPQSLMWSNDIHNKSIDTKNKELNMDIQAKITQ